jgi:hypothetical protein
VFLLCSASIPSRTPPPNRSRAQRASEVSGSLGAPEGHDPQVSVAGTTSNNRTQITKTIPEADTTSVAGATASSTMGEVAANGPASMTGATARVSSAPGDDDNVVEDPKVVMGHPGLGAPGHVSVTEAVDIALFALHQV